MFVEAVDEGLGLTDAAVVGVEPDAVELALLFVDKALDGDFPLAAERFHNVGPGFAADENAIGLIGKAGREVKVDLAVADADAVARLGLLPAERHGVERARSLHEPI